MKHLQLQLLSHRASFPAVLKMGVEPHIVVSLLLPFTQMHATAPAGALHHLDISEREGSAKGDLEVNKEADGHLGNASLCKS